MSGLRNLRPEATDGATAHLPSLTLDDPHRTYVLLAEDLAIGSDGTLSPEVRNNHSDPSSPFPSFSFVVKLVKAG